MIKCPHCGSTSQVQIIKEYWSKISQSACKHYTCGCGCTFQTEKWIDGTIHGYWQIKEKEGK